MPKTILAALSLFVVVVVGCSDEDGDPTGGGVTGQTQLDGGGESDADISLGGADAVADAPADLGSVDVTDEPTADATDASGGPVVNGLVAVFETRSPAVDQLNSGGVGAGFAVPEETTETPPLAEFGDCSVSAVDPDSNPFETGPSLDAGDVAVQLGGEQVTMTLRPADDGMRYGHDLPEDRSEFFAPGLTVRVAAAGGVDVPAFEGTVSSPRDPVVTGPAWTGTNGEVQRNQALTVSWTGTGPGDAIVNILPIQIFPEPGLGTGNAITCVAADSGSLVVPAEALAMFPAAAAFGPNAAITVVVTSNTTLEVGQGEVLLNATASHTVVGSIK